MRRDRRDDRERRSGARALRDAALCGFVLAALGACRSVVVVPDDASWTLTGKEETAEATWRTGPISVTVPLALRGDATMLTGTIRNAGPATVMTFVPSIETERRGLGGVVTGTRPEAGGSWRQEVVPWQEIEAPAGTPESPSTVEFALWPDRPWTDTTAPDLGATIRWVVHFAGEFGQSNCPVLFHVVEAQPGWMYDPRTQSVVALIALAGLIVWAAYL
jgi:hypothetical protein